jgi:hypothetical protein
MKWDDMISSMKSPQISYFEVSTADDPHTLEQLKERTAAEMKTKIEAETGPKDIRFSFRPLTEPSPGLVMNIRWEVRADF